MTEIIRGADGLPASLESYEARIALYKEQIGTGYIGIGRTLIEAKDAGVVPHGEWESWVEQVTGLSIRQAQKCMQAAREIREGTSMARLEMSKALMLLQSGLEEDEREELAKQAEEGATVKELKEQIRALKLEKVQNAGVTAEMKGELKKAREERDQVQAQLRASMHAYNERLEEARNAAYENGKMDGGTAAARENVILQDRLKKTEDMVKAAQIELRHAEEKVRAAETRVADAEKNAKDAMGEERKEWIRQMEQLRADLDAAESREEKRAAEVAALRKEKTQAGMDAARGIGVSSPGALDLTAAVRDFIGRAGVLPQMGNLISGMRREEREQILAQVETVARWVADSRKALGVVTADASIQ